jgi:histidinol-phosphatase (PHP family)
MTLYDQHLHSRFSFDSEADPRDNVLAALRRRLAGLTFTEHFDTHPNEWPDCRYDDRQYSEMIARLREEFGDRLFIGKGIEICYQPQRMPFVLDFLDRHSFDIILVSVHWTEHGPVHSRRYWEWLGLRAGIESYLRRVLDAARFCAEQREQGGRPFDVLAHLDLAKRYTHRFLAANIGPEHATLFDEILHACLQADLIPEINTSGARSPLAEPMPNGHLVRRYASLGGTMMTLGSDAHVADHVGEGLADAAAMLRSAGIRQMAVFRDRRLETLPLE